MRRLYAERRALTAAGLAQVLSPRVRIAPQPGGMHLLLQLPDAAPGADAALAARMRADGMAAHALSERAMQCRHPPALLLGFTNIPSQERAVELGRRILALMYGPVG
jgi:GntR family transcriptional regulator/MocR family aminotransferase